MRDRWDIVIGIFAIAILCWTALPGNAGPSVEQLIAFARHNPSEEACVQWLNTHGWPRIGIAELLRLLRSPVPTPVILQMAERSIGEGTRIEKVEGNSIWLRGHMRVVIEEINGRRRWWITNMDAQGKPLAPVPAAAPAPERRVIEIVRAETRPAKPERPRLIYIHRKRRPPERRYAPLYLFPNPIYWQLTCLLQGLRCPVVRPAPAQGLPDTPQWHMRAPNIVSPWAGKKP